MCKGKFHTYCAYLGQAGRTIASWITVYIDTISDWPWATTDYVRSETVYALLTTYYNIVNCKFPAGIYKKVYSKRYIFA